MEAAHTAGHVTGQRTASKPPQFWHDSVGTGQDESEAVIALAALREAVAGLDLEGHEYGAVLRLYTANEHADRILKRYEALTGMDLTRRS